MALRPGRCAKLERLSLAYVGTYSISLFGGWLLPELLSTVLATLQYRTRQPRQIPAVNRRACVTEERNLTFAAARAARAGSRGADRGSSVGLSRHPVIERHAAVAN